MPQPSRQVRRITGIAVRALGVGALSFLVCVLVLEVFASARAENVLIDHYEGNEDSIIRSQIPVYELIVSRDKTYPGPYLFDVFINARYCATPEAQKLGAVGKEVFHFFGWDYDGYCLPAGKNKLGDEVLYFVDLTFSRSVALLACAISCLLLTVVAGALQLVNSNYAFKRDCVDDALEAAFANASHELKSPLMAIQGYAESVQCHAVDEDFALPRIVAASEKMIRTIDGILKISRSDAGLQKPELDMWDIREIVYDEARMIEEDCDRRGISLNIELSSPLRRPCDAAMLSTVLLNVLDNACRHAETYIRVSEGRKVGSSIEILVENDGASPSPDVVAHAFDRFYKGVSGSTGIGLAVSREYIGLMGGQIDMLPTSKGTCVRIRL